MHSDAASWLTAGEIAQLGVPGVPTDKRRVNALAVAEGWAGRTSEDGVPLARLRRARGGGTEYHVSLLPVAAQAALEARRNRQGMVASLPIAANDDDATANRWAWFEEQPASIKAKAVFRNAILAEIDAAVFAGTGKTAATAEAARRHGVSARAIASWFAAVHNVPAADRLPHLAPSYKGGGKEVEIDAEAWRILKTDYLRPEKPAFAACYHRLKEDYADPRGIELPDMKTMKRRLDRQIRPTLRKAKREGREALRRSVPPQRRSVAGLHAMEAVNVDGHTFDVFVQWEDGRIGRPVMVGIQDVASRKLLAYRIGETESTMLTRLAFADLFRDYGIPPHAVMDNGRAFASKALTGGALTRFRFKIKDTDAIGVLTALHVKVHWTLPYRGSSKPIERLWRDLCEDIAKHPRVAGAYTGNRPDAKPENYRERAIPIADFRAHVADRIAKHNARTGRKAEMLKGRSFDEAFAASYEVSPIGKAAPEQVRRAMLEAVGRRCNKETGAVTLGGNIYWSPEMVELAGEVVTLFFDPENFHAGVDVYRRDGTYFGFADVIDATGFFDKAGSEKRAKLEKNLARKVRETEEAAELLRVDQLAELLSGPTTSVPLPEAKVVRPVRHRGNTVAALKSIQQVEAMPGPATPSFSDNVLAGFEKRRLRSVE